MKDRMCFHLNNLFYRVIFLLLLCSSIGCDNRKEAKELQEAVIAEIQTAQGVSLIVLGTVQDAGSPQIGCLKSCCAHLFNTPDPTRKVVSLGLIDHENNLTFLFEATPDITSQLRVLKEQANVERELPNGIFLTHAHIGHYTGLMYLGKEAINASNVPVYLMPGMKNYLETNGPWNQLVELKNISLVEMTDMEFIELSSSVSITPFLVPHRDEYSETVGYKISGPEKTAIFIPDIDKWSKWDEDIVKWIKNADYAFLDATFYDGNELGRDMSQIPHPFVVESMRAFKGLPETERSKIYFIHINHTNPILNPDSAESMQVIDRGYNVARYLDRIDL